MAAFYEYGSTRQEEESEVYSFQRAVALALLWVAMLPFVYVPLLSGLGLQV